MKKLLLSLLLATSSILTYCQVPNFLPDRSGPAVTAQDARLRARLNFYFPHVHGLTLNGGLDTVGMVLFEDSSRHVWIRDGLGWAMLLKTGDIAGGVTSFNTRVGAVVLSSPDVTGALGFTPLSAITSFIQGGSNVTLSGLGTLASPYIINAASGPGTVTNFAFTNGNGITGSVSNPTSTPTLSLGTSLNGIIKGNGTGFGTIVIGSGLTYDGTTLAVTSGGGSVTTVGFTNANGITGSVSNPTTTPNITLGTALNGLVDANGTGFSTATIGAGLSFGSGTLTNTINNTNQLTNGAGFLTNITGLITQGSNVTITGSGTSGSPYNISVAGAGTGTVTNFSAGNLSPLFTTTVTNSTTIPGLTFSLSTAAPLSVFGNNTGSTAAPVFFTPNSTIITSWLGYTPGTINGSITATQVAVGNSSNTITGFSTFTFSSGNLTTPNLSLTSLVSAGINDSVLTIDPTTKAVHWRSGAFNLFAVNGVSSLGGSGDSIGLGGNLYQNTVIGTVGVSLSITGLPNKSSALGTDSMIIEDAAGKMWKLPITGGSGPTPGLSQVLAVSNITPIPIVDSNSVTGDSAVYRNVLGTGNVIFGDSILTVVPIYTFYGSSLTASPGPCAAVGWVTLFTADRQIIPVDSAIPGTGISPNCPLNPALAMIHRIPGLPVHTANAKFLFDAGVNDVYSDSVAYALALGQILDTLTMNRGWAASDIYVISSFCASRITDTQLLKVNIKVCTPRGVNIVDVLHTMYYHYHILGQVTNCPDSVHPTTLGQHIAESVISNAVKTGHFYGNMQNSGWDTVGGNLTVKGTSRFVGKITPLGGYQQVVNDGHFDHFGIQTNGGDFSEERFITSNVSAGDTMALRHTVQAGNGSSFDFMHYETTGQVNMLHIGGSTNAVVINGTTPLAGYLLTVNGAASMGQANVTAGLYVAGDANYIPYRLPLFTNGGTHIGIGINSSNVCEFDNAFGPWAFGSGGASFVAKTEVLANGHILANVTVSATDTLASWLQVRGLSYLGDSVNLGRVATGTTADSVIMIGANHYIHKLAFSAFSGGGGFPNPMTAAGQIIYGGSGGTPTATGTPGHAGMRPVFDGTNVVWTDTTAAGAGGGVTTVGTFSGSSQTNGASISSVTITFGPADGTNPGMIKATGSQTLGSTLVLTMPGGTIFGSGTGNNTTLIRGTTAIHIGDNGTQNVFINEAATTSTATLFIRTASQWNSSDINIHGQMDIDGAIYFNSTSSTTGGILHNVAGDNYFDANTSTGGDFWRTNAGATSLMHLVGSNAHLLVGSVTDQTLGQLQSTSTTTPQVAMYFDATHLFTEQVGSGGILTWGSLTGWKVPSTAFGTTFTAGTDSMLIAHNASGIETISLAVAPSSSTYTPTGTSSINVSSATGGNTHYIRVGNQMFVTGNINVTATAPGLVIVLVSIPVASTLVGGDLSGTGTVSQTTLTPCQIIEDTGSGKAALSYTASGTSGTNIYFHFAYTIH